MKSERKDMRIKYALQAIKGFLKAIALNMSQAF